MANGDIGHVKCRHPRRQRRPWERKNYAYFVPTEVKKNNEKGEPVDEEEEPKFFDVFMFALNLDRDDETLVPGQRCLQWTSVSEVQ